MENRKYRIDFNEGSDHAIQYLVGMAQDTRLVTLQVVSKIDIEALDWQYQPGWNTIGALLDHIAAVEHFFRIEFIDNRKLTEAEYTRWEAALDMGEHLPKLIGIKSVQDYKHTLTESGELFTEAISQIDLTRFNEQRSEYDEVNGSNLAWILYHKVEDEIYHRGQISLILKLYKESLKGN